MKMLDLKCWVYPEDVENCFRVEIPSSLTVSDLKETIKHQNLHAFGAVNASALRLYTIPSSEDLHSKLKLWNPSGKTRLNGRSKLSKEFSGPEKVVIIKLPATFDSRTALPSGVPVLSLHYWVRGALTATLLHTKIAGTRTVADLRSAIKDEIKPTFDDLWADQLTVYKVSLPCANNDAFREKLGSLSISTLENKERLADGSKRLSEIFSPPPVDNHLHLIIEGSVPLQCWVRRQGFEMFRVQVLASATVNDAKNVIRAANEELRSYSSHRLDVFEILPDMGINEALNTPGSGRLLYGCRFLRETLDDVPFFSVPRVVIELVNDRTWPPRLAYHHTGDDDPVETERATFLKTATEDKPSESGVSSSCQRRQLDVYKSIPCGLPRDFEETIPTTLLHPVFGQFLDDCQTIDVTAADNTFVERLTSAMSLISDREWEWARIKAIRKEFEHYFLMEFDISATQTGYVMDTHVNAHEYRYVIAEFKNEKGDTPAEPYLRAIERYLESTRNLALRFKRSPLPCLLVTVFGSHLEFAGAAWNLCPTAQLLSTPVALHFHSTDVDNRLRVARHMAAFCKAITRLQGYYENLQEALPPTSAPVPPYIFPYPTSYTSLEDGTLKHFHYLKDLMDDRLIFVGDGDDGRICIKFVHAYSREAHAHLAHLGCAPRLYGFEKLFGGWFMVVMELLPDEFQMICDYKRNSLSDAVFKEISAKLTSLHDAGYVHGDVRAGNILLSRDKKRIMFIDFDWAGPVNEVKYPACVNWELVERPEDARDGKLVTIAHDKKMLEYIVSDMCGGRQM